MVGARREHLERLRSYGLRRAEVVMLDRSQEGWLREYLAGMTGGFSFHCPAFHLEDYPEYPLLASLVDPNRERQERALEFMRRELDQAAAWGARHLVVHLQRNLLMHGEPCPAGWGEREGLNLAVDTVGRLLEASAAVGVPVHLENMMGSPLLHSPEAYQQLARALPQVRYCLDVGHAALDARQFGFTEIELARAMAPSLASLHVYDNWLPAEFDFLGLREQGLLRKYPVHPAHAGQEGWIDTVGCLREALTGAPGALVTFEVYYSMDTNHAETAQGLDWAMEVCREATRAAVS